MLFIVTLLPKKRSPLSLNIKLSFFLCLNLFWQNFNIQGKEGLLMADTFSKEQRRKNMQTIRSQLKFGNLVSKKLWKRGVRFRKNGKSLFGKLDISIKKYGVVIFINSLFCMLVNCKVTGLKAIKSIGI